MGTAFWAKAHGASTHFPLALILCSALFDAAGFALNRRAIVRELHVAGYWSLLSGAISSLPAVYSGLLLTKGSLLGHGVLRLHHLFVWPAFALLVALATWRAMVGRQMTRRALGVYLAGAALTSVLLIGAG